MAAAAQWPLIGPGDPAPFTLYNPQGRAPFLLVCDHASRAFPAALQQLGLADWVLEKHVACDIGAANLTQCLADRFDAPAILAGYSRLLIDLNRQLHSRAAIPPVSDGIAVPGNLNLTEADRAARIQSFFDPYHGAISDMLRRMTHGDRVPALLSIHTCTPVFNRTVRRWHIGVMYDVDARIAKPLLQRLGEVDELCVGDNEPYSGRHPNDFTIDYHAEQTGLPCVGIEVRQDLVATSEGAYRWAGIVGDAFETVLADASLFVRRSTP